MHGQSVLHQESVSAALGLWQTTWCWRDMYSTYVRMTKRELYIKYVMVKITRENKLKVTHRTVVNNSEKTPLE